MRAWVFAALMTLGAGSVGHANCRQALALGLDVSGSVDAREYRLQLDGLARALLRRDVRDAFLALPGTPVELYVYEWAGLGTQRELVPWTAINEPIDLNSVADRLMSTPRVEGEPPTAIGQAMLIGGRALAKRPDCWRHTLDLSGDGKSNTGPRPRDLKNIDSLAHVTINALVIGAASGVSADRRQGEIADLWAYFKIEVIRGPQAFIEVAVDFEDFEDAMARKLLKELQTLAVSENSNR